MRKNKNNDFTHAMKFMGSKFWPFILGTLGSNLIMAFCVNIVMAIIMKDLFNAASQGDSELFLRAIYVGLLSLMVAIFIRPFFVYIARKAQKSTMKELKLRVFEHVIDLPMSFFENGHSGSLISKLTNDIKIIEDIYDIHLDRMIFVLMLGMGSTMLMFILDWRISLYVLFFEGLSIASSMFISKRIRRITDEVQFKKGETNQRFLDLLFSIKTTKMYQMEKDVVEDYTRSNDGLALAEMRRDQLEATISALNSFFYSFKSVGVIVIGLYLISQKTWDIGTLVAMFNLQNNMGILSEVGGAIGKIQGSLSGVYSITALLQESRERRPSIRMTSMDVCRDRSIQIKNATFSYRNKRILDRIDISVKKGESIAIVGRSGCGKSTIAKLLLGFYELTEGEVLLDGLKSTDISLNNVRQKIAYVPQDSYLFEGTIKENIRYGNLNATDEEIIKAAIMANAHGFIMENEKGYNTTIYEGGTRMSGGQKQRIALARALVKGVDILVLDESTDALDKETEEQVMATIKDLMKIKTVIIITHRLETLKDVGTIFMLDEGKIKERGSDNLFIY